MYHKVAGDNASKKGYLAHESGLWSEIHQRYFFAPRKFSTQKRTKKVDPTNGTNLLISCDENFENMIIRNVLDLIPLHGISDMAFVPNSGDTEFITTRTIEDGDRVESFIAVFDLLGNVLFPET